MAYDFKMVQLGNGGMAKQVVLLGQMHQGRALICERAPMEERHLNGGAGGGYSRVSLNDDHGRPKMVTRCRIVKFCGLHQVVWDGDAGCPQCGQQ
jgi:hypothetical protein